MTTKTINTYVAAGYTLSSAYSRLVITAAGGIGGTGLYAASYAKVLNRGVIHGHYGSDGIDLNAGGLVQNGAANHTSALIEGRRGVVVNGGAGSVVNFGTIEGAAHGSPAGVYLSAGGGVTNGSEGDITAQILGYRGVYVTGGAGAVANFGTITGVYASGVKVADGVVTNGSATDESALIQSVGIANGVSLGVGTVSNFGTITCAQGSTAVLLFGYGAAVVTNGSAADTVATIQGGRGVFLYQYGTVANFGSIVATRTDSGGVGVQLSGGGAVVNGGAASRTALISGYLGIDAGYFCTVMNYGTVMGTGAGDSSYGVKLGGYSTLTNFGTISGRFGVYAGVGYATVINFGTIAGTGGAAIRLGSAGVLVVEAGCAFLGGVDGGYGALDLDSGNGRLSLLAGDGVTVSGSMATTTFNRFRTVEIGAAATFSSSGLVTIGDFDKVIDAGSLTLGGAKAAVANGGTIETLGGTLTVKGAVTGAGQATIDGGLLDFASSFNQNVTFSGTTGVLELARSRGYTGAISGFSTGGGTYLDLADIAFIGAGEASFSGTATSGVLTVSDGTRTAHITLIGDYLASTFIAASDGHGGTIIHDPKAPAAAPSASHAPRHRFIAAMAGLGSGGAGLEWGAAHRSHAPPALTRPHAQAA